MCGALLVKPCVSRLRVLRNSTVSHAPSRAAPYLNDSEGGLVGYGEEGPGEDSCLAWPKPLAILTSYGIVVSN